MPGNQDKILILNVGSSSLKLRLYSKDKIIEDKSFDLKNNNLKEILSKSYSVIENCLPIPKVGYRIVHGGNLDSPSQINKKVLNTIKKFSYLNPNHSKNILETIKFFMNKIKSKHFVCSDNHFHLGLSEKATTYSLPKKILEKYGIKKYGFHGLAHESLMINAQKFAGKKYEKIISCQLGSGVSLCAIKNGKSIDTTMGFSPIEGIIMQTRSGSIDPEIIFYLNKKGIPLTKIKGILEFESGLKGLSGLNDMRKIIETKNKSVQSKLAFEIFIYQIKKMIGSYVAALGEVDLIVLGGGISRAPEIRKGILEGLEIFGIKINDKRINQKSPALISSGKVDVIVLETDEQEQIFKMIKKV